MTKEIEDKYSSLERALPEALENLEIIDKVINSLPKKEQVSFLLFIKLSKGATEKYDKKIEPTLKEKIAISRKRLGIAINIKNDIAQYKADTNVSQIRQDLDSFQKFLGNSLQSKWLRPFTKNEARVQDYELINSIYRIENLSNSKDSDELLASYREFRRENPLQKGNMDIGHDMIFNPERHEDVPLAASLKKLEEFRDMRNNLTLDDRFKMSHDYLCQDLDLQWNKMLSDIKEFEDKMKREYIPQKLGGYVGFMRKIGLPIKANVPDYDILLVLYKRFYRSLQEAVWKGFRGYACSMTGNNGWIPNSVKKYWDTPEKFLKAMCDEIKENKDLYREYNKNLYRIRVYNLNDEDARTHFFGSPYPLIDYKSYPEIASVSSNLDETLNHTYLKANDISDEDFIDHVYEQNKEYNRIILETRLNNGEFSRDVVENVSGSIQLLNTENQEKLEKTIKQLDDYNKSLLLKGYENGVYVLSMDDSSKNGMDLTANAGSNKDLTIKLIKDKTCSLPGGDFILPVIVQGNLALIKGKIFDESDKQIKMVPLSNSAISKLDDSFSFKSSGIQLSQPKEHTR